MSYLSFLLLVSALAIELHFVLLLVILLYTLYARCADLCQGHTSRSASSTTRLQIIVMLDQVKEEEEKKKKIPSDRLFKPVLSR